MYLHKTLGKWEYAGIIRFLSVDVGNGNWQLTMVMVPVVLMVLSSFMTFSFTPLIFLTDASSYLFASWFNIPALHNAINK